MTSVITRAVSATVGLNAFLLKLIIDSLDYEVSNHVEVYFTVTKVHKHTMKTNKIDSLNDFTFD